MLQPELAEALGLDLATAHDVRAVASIVLRQGQAGAMSNVGAQVTTDGAQILVLLAQSLSAAVRRTVAPRGVEARRISEEWARAYTGPAGCDLLATLAPQVKLTRKNVSELGGLGEEAQVELARRLPRFVSALLETWVDAGHDRIS